MRSQTFGVEIEMTGVTRKKAARRIADHFGGSRVEHRDSFAAYVAGARQGRGG